MKKVISMILAVAMVLSLVPATVAESPEVEFKLGDVTGDGALCITDAMLILIWDVFGFDGKYPKYATVFDNDERARKAAQIADGRHISFQAVGHFLEAIEVIDLDDDDITVVIRTKSVDEAGNPIIVKEGMKKLEEVWGEGYNYRLATCEDCCLFCESCGDPINLSYLRYMVNPEFPVDYVSRTRKCERECGGLGDVNNDGEVDINDALQTLMYVAGMPSSTLNESDENLQAALITDKAKEEGEPAIGDVLHILMYSADMPGSLLNG